jgi:hypothetical protein
LGKKGVNFVVFCGEIVVQCVVNVVNFRHFLRAEKWDTFCKFIFGCELRCSASGDAASGF